MYYYFVHAISTAIVSSVDVSICSVVSYGKNTEDVEKWRLLYTAIL